ncbi:MAG TPA: asparaginase [Blastococcus sp.]|nr:asparaginase [Blastococcus sp.]
MAVFSLGGTIASTGQAGGGVTPRLGADELVDAVPGLHDVAAIEAIAFRQVPSGDLTFADLVALAAEIERRLATGCTGVVVTQGTDTVEETSFALDLLVRSPRPVVVTGAMRNPTLAGADGPANLLAAVRVAASQGAAGLGTLVVAGDEIHAARFVRKTHTSSPSTFRSGTAGALGWVVEDRVRIGLRVPPLPPLVAGVEGDVPPVALLPCALGDDGRLLGRLRSLGYAGAVVQALGGGHVPAAVVPALEELARQVPVVLASRTGGGEVLTSTYGFPGSERDLLARGLVPAGFLDGPKARVLLSLLLAGGAGIEAVRTAFARVAGPCAEIL